MPPLPGDFGLTQIHGRVGKLIRLGQWLNGSGFEDFEHAFIYIGNGQIIEAEPGGARIAFLSEYDHNTIVWSSGKIEIDEAQRNGVVLAAMGYLRVRYSFLDYQALVMHRLHLWAPGLKRYIATSKHMICSQLVDQCYQDGGVMLLPDGRWPGYVTPGDLYKRIS